jgi:ElaA protein
MLHYEIIHFDQIDLPTFHDLVALRIQIFVIEQNCPYQDLDGKDKKAFHVIGRDDNGKIQATARILPEGISYTEHSIGRVAVHSNHRMEGEGRKMMNKCLSFMLSEFGPVAIRISAQKHLAHFYASLGFNSTGKEYLEDGIPHVEMLKEKK